MVRRLGWHSGCRRTESAIATPRETFSGRYLNTKIWALAAAYLFHPVENHAFVDGNKRVGCERGNHFPLTEWLGMELHRGLSSSIRS
jgi:death-on-curing protein